ncbi:MAG: type II secretion system protein GspE [Acidobacteria bacterium]|nr:type II secretion system protein GspE [Acidobacteriota bacterium]
MRQRLGEILIAKGQLQPDELDKGLALQRERGDRLGRLLVEMGLLSSRDVLVALSEQLGVPLITAKQFPEAGFDVDGISIQFMKQSRIVPISSGNDVITLVMSDPLDSETIAAVRNITKKHVKVSLADEQEIIAVLDQYFPEDESEALTETAGEGNAEDSQNLEHLRDLASEAPVIRLVNHLISRAVERSASDIHLEPMEKQFHVRYRLDGVLHAADSPPRELQAAVISRVKLMAKLNIAERRLPQDGRIQLKILGREVDLRVSTLPTLHGESVVMRLLDRSESGRYDLKSLGFSDAMMTRMEHFEKLSFGMFLVTGPTGSGKSTTLYSALRGMNTAERKVITIEDPVEYQINGVNQIHVNPQIGLTFAAGLRHIVRQDPDVIMVGEIRDRETADIAIRAALTGHLVLSTLHTNDAPSAITRLTDMGMENYLLTSSIVAVLAQRLVRVLCTICKKEEKVSVAWLRSLGLAPSEMPADRQVPIWRGPGCDACDHTGYRGRVGIFELMELDEELRRLIVANADAVELARSARGRGMRTLLEDGMEKVLTGVTTPEEILRVTQIF